MTDSKDTSKKNWLLPSSPEELEQFVKRTLGGAIGLIEEERAAVYSRVSVIDPNARSYSMEYQPDRSEEYAVSKGWRIIAKYEDPDRTGRNSRRPGLQALIRDINDTETHARELAALVKGLLCHVNVIPLNPTADYTGQATTAARAKEFKQVLESLGVPCTIRLRRGIDIQAGCGQLAAGHA